jgi:hypothetical protein
MLESDEGSRDWVSVPALRRAWYLFLGGTIAFILLSIFPLLAFRPVLASTESGSFIYRLAVVTLLVLVTAGNISLAFLYFKFALGRKISIRLATIFQFYFYVTVWFGFLYYSLYILNPSFFLYDYPPVLILPRVSATAPDWFAAMRMKGDFLLFSAFQTVNGSFYKIQPRSTVVSIATYGQTLFTISLVSLFIAAYVNRKTADTSTSQNGD